MSGVCNSARARRRLNIFSRIAMPLGFVITVISLITLNVGAASSPFQITGASITAKSDGVEASIGGFEDTKINSTATFYHINDSITYKVTLQNTTGKEYKIGTISDDNTNPYLTYSYPAHAGETVAAGENLELDVTVTYTASIPSPESRTQNLDVKFSFEYEEVPAGNSEETTEPTEPTEKETEPEEEPEDDIVVPSTDAGEETAVPDTGASTNNKNGGASVDVLSIVGTVIGVSLIIFGIIKSRKLSERTKVLAFAALGTLTAASVANAASSSFTFGFDSSFNLKNLLSVSYTVEGVKTTTVINYGETLQIETPVKPGSKFAGWQTADGTIIPDTQEISEDTEIEATWTPITYTVSIDTDGDGTADIVDEISYGEEIVLPTNTTTNPGHNPNGWVDGDGNHYSDGATISNLTTEDGATISLTPDFTPNQFTVNIDTDGDGTDDQTLNVTYGETANLPTNENSIPGHTANGWVDGDGNHYDDGADIGGETFDNGATIELAPDFTPNQYTVNIDTDGDGDVDYALSVTYGDTANLPDNTNGSTGYLPNGWVDGDGNHYDDGFDISSLTIADGSEITLTPVIEPIQYTVNIDTDGDGNADISDTVEYNENYTLPANDTAERNGYDRNGWTDGTNHYDDNAVISNLTTENGATISIVPDWTLVTYNISYSFYGVGSSTVDNSANPTTYTVEDNLTFTAPTVDGYRFLRWSIPRANVSSVASATVSVDAGTAYTALTAYAWYEERTDVPYIVKHYIRDIDGNFTEDSSVPSEGRPGQTLQINDLKKSITGYTMIGAFDTDSGTTMPTSGSVTSTTILANGTRVISIYYRPYELKIKYNLNGGSLGEGNTVYSSKDGFLTPIDDPENTEFLAGVYGSKVTLAYATGTGINIEKLGYNVAQSYQWAVGPEVGAFAFEQGETGEDAQGFYYQDISRGDKTMTMYLDWIEEIYMLNYYDAVDDSLPTSYTVNREVTIPELTTNSNGQYFEGWTDKDTGADLGRTFTIPVGSTGRRNFQAHWHKKRYHITYNANGGTGEPMATTNCDYNYSCTLESNNFTREYFDFAGWTINDFDWHTLVGPIVIDKTAGDDDVTFTAYAIWEPYPEVHYNGNGADAGEMPVQKIKAGEEVTFLAPNYSRAGYGFVGWNTKEDGTGTLYGPNETVSQMPYGGITLYAMWLEAEQGVTMQTFDKSAEPYASYYPEQRIALRDERDGNVYVITKLTNDVWWMAENLRLNPNDANTTINEFNTNNPADGFAEAAKALSADELWSCNSGENCSNKIGIGLGNINRENDASPTASNRESSWYGYGVMYNYYTAVAGNKRSDPGNADGDICPSGWHIPTGGATSGRDYYGMYNGAASGGNPGEAYMSSVYRRYAYNLVYSGSYTKNASYGANGRGIVGRYWSSTQQSNNTAYLAYLGKESEKLNGSNYTSLSEYTGYAVRCIANTPTSYILTYEKGANYVTNMPANQTITSVPKRHVFTVSSTIPEREGYTFLGWGLIPDGDDIVYQPGDEIVTTKIGVRIYARWELTPVDNWTGIRYDKNGADVVGMMADQEATAGEKVKLDAPNFSRAGYGFAGWSTTADDSGDVYGPIADFIVPAEGKATLYARWVAPENGVTMQTFDSTASPYASAPQGTVIALRDERDDNVYTVAKFIDDNWWMSENLRLDLSTDGDKITAANTNNPTADFLAVANSKPASSNDWHAANGSAIYDQVAYNSDNLSRVGDDARYSYGIYYNHFTYTAGNGTSDLSGRQRMAGDICPSGWSLPTADSETPTDNYYRLVYLLTGKTAGASTAVPFRAAPYNFTYSGIFDYNGSNSINNRGIISYYASASLYGGTSNYIFYMEEYMNDWDYNPPRLAEYVYQSAMYLTNWGYTVRCIAN